MEFALSVIPSVVLLAYIYRLDKKEKEPVDFLLRLFTFGALVTWPVSTIEGAVSSFIVVKFSMSPVVWAMLKAFVVAGLCEETGKYLILKNCVWDDRHFNCTFDGIVYAVFVSLGMATLENIFYVADGGIRTALARMFTSIPGHMSFAVYMGFFFSRMKLAAIRDDYRGYVRNRTLAIIVPIFIHGLYDCILMVNRIIPSITVQSQIMKIWYEFIIILFLLTFILVKRASRKDAYFS